MGYSSVSKVNQKVCYNDVLQAKVEKEKERNFVNNCASAIAIDLIQNGIGDANEFLKGFFNLVLEKMDKLAISCIGEIGRMKDLSSLSNQIEQSLIKIILNQDEKYDSEIMSYAAKSFGLVIAGSDGFLNPTFDLINKIQSGVGNPASLHLLLKSLYFYINASKYGKLFIEKLFQSITQIYSENSSDAVKTQIAL